MPNVHIGQNGIVCPPPPTSISGAGVGLLLHVLTEWLVEGAGALAAQLRFVNRPPASRPLNHSEISVFPLPLLRGDSTGDLSSNTRVLANLWIACLNELHAGHLGLKFCHYLQSAAQRRAQCILIARARRFLRAALGAGLVGQKSILDFLLVDESYVGAGGAIRLGSRACFAAEPATCDAA